MNNDYNANMYLDRKYLNTLEHDIAYITEDVQIYLFDGEKARLKTLEIDDNLNSKVLYLSLPRNLYDDDYTSFVFIKTDNNNSININKSESMFEIIVTYSGSSFTLYSHEDGDINPSVNVRKFKFPYDFGTITQVNQQNDILSYFRILDNDLLIPHYNIYTWDYDEILSMQKIDNIENGIENIGKYYYKPDGWISSREWLKISTIENIDNGMNIQNISYQDLNRWNNNLSLINFDDLDKMTIWNSNITQLEWDEQSDIEWEDL